MEADVMVEPGILAELVSRSLFARSLDTFAHLLADSLLYSTQSHLGLTKRLNS